MDAETTATSPTNPTTFEDLAQVVEHELFPDVDLALRRGRHIDREDGAWYGYLTDAQAHLERFYRRYGAELVQRTDGFFFLLPSGDKLGRRHLSPSEMLVGQGLTLLYLEPATVEQGGVTTRDQVLSQLSASMGTEQLMLAFNAKKKRMDERVAQEMVRARVSEAIRRLSTLGFVDLLPEERIRLRSSLMRFAEPVRGSGADLEALTRLVASGEISLTEDADAERDSEEASRPNASRGPQAMPVTEWNEGSEWGASFESEGGEDEPPPEYVAAAQEPEEETAETADAETETSETVEAEATTTEIVETETAAPTPVETETAAPTPVETEALAAEVADAEQEPPVPEQPPVPQTPPAPPVEDPPFEIPPPYEEPPTPFEEPPAPNEPPTPYEPSTPENTDEPARETKHTTEDEPATEEEWSYGNDPSDEELP